MKETNRQYYFRLKPLDHVDIWNTILKTDFISHTKKYIFRGIVAIIPLSMVYIVLSFLFNFIDKKITNLFKNYFGFTFPGIGIVCLLVLLYVFGLLTSLFIFKWLLYFIETAANKIPVIGATYKVGKRIANTLLLPEKDVFKKVVWIDFWKQGNKTVGFVTGYIMDKKNNDEYLKIFVPTTPNPTSGFLIIAKKDDVFDPGWTIEEGINSIISGGLIGPKEINIDEREQLKVKSTIL